MSVTYVSAELRRLVVERASTCCEYCLISEEATYYGCAVDHVIGEKHGGPTEPDNLAFACAFCNRAKGSDIGSMHWATGEFTRLFNPRIDRWADHFALIDNWIAGLTPIGEVTVRLLGFNRINRLSERLKLQKAKRYPKIPGS
jgi:hypothetical protein